jgi:hypothetical protein
MDPVLQFDGPAPLGMDSFRDPRLEEGLYVRGWNVINRGGIIKTRPGTRKVLNLPDGVLQGATYFTPRRGGTQLIAFVDGQGYVSEFPFRNFYKIDDFTMAPSVSKLFFCHTEQALSRNSDDSLTLLPVPRKVLMIQDGKGPCMAWDGVMHERQVGYDGTPQGTAMAWSGHRLWVARDNQIFASDYANPFSFVEQFYLGGSDSFFAPDRVVAMAEVVGANQPQLLIWTANDTITVQSNILNRELWTTTPDFVRMFLPGVGCISHRSVVPHFGAMWWFSQYGLTSLDVATMVHLTSAFPLVDAEMISSKAYMAKMEGLVAGIPYQNFLLMSVPYGNRYNRHTWVLDTSVRPTMAARQTTPAWAGVWTGFWPVDWISFSEDGRDRTFAAITDGTKNQIIELDSNLTRDSHQDIEAAVELRVLTHGTPNEKEVQYADLMFSEIRGDVDIAADWRGLARGPLHRCLTTRVRSGVGSLRAGTRLNNVSRIFSTRGQSRRLRTQQINRMADELNNACGIESTEIDRRDHGFNLLVSWSGCAALREVRLGALPINERNVGRCEQIPTDVVFVKFDGHAGTTLEAILNEDAVFTGSQQVETNINGAVAAFPCTSQSLVSQQAADKQALQQCREQNIIALDKAVVPALSTDPP